MEKMVQKSIRMPSDIAEFVSSRSGADFSKKLVSLISEFRDGDVERSLMLQRYDEQIAERRDRLKLLMSDISAVSRIHCRVLDLVHEVEKAEPADVPFG